MSTYGVRQVLREFNVYLSLLYAYYVYVMAFAKQSFNQVHCPDMVAGRWDRLQK